MKYWTLVNNDPAFFGVLGSLVLVIGAAWPVKASGHPARSTKNQLFAAGNVCMFMYSALNYLQGGSIFFILLQVLIGVSTVLMLLNTNDLFDACVLAGIGSMLVVYSIFLFRDPTTILFVLGLCILGVGYAMNMASYKRQVALAVGSAFIAWFSYLEGEIIFLWLNIFFAGFSTYYAWQMHPKQIAAQK